MGKHTPGPWRATHVDHPTRHWLVEIPGINREMVGDRIVVGESGGPDDVVAVDAANARLIAAAPDLAAVLASLLSFAESCHRALVYSGEHDDKTPPVCAAARAALKKAGVR